VLHADDRERNQASETHPIPERAMSESTVLYDYELDDDEAGEPCEYCGGDGGDPWNDGILPCPRCDGMGYDWWN
jgi:hypothetical protein